MTERSTGPSSRQMAKRSRRRRRYRRRLAIFIPIGIVVLLGAAAAWIGVRGLAAQEILEEAVPVTEDIKDAILAGDGAGVRAQAAELAERTAEAVSLTSDPVWRLAEFVPFLGGNLTAVRVAVDVVDGLVNEVVIPAAAVDLDAVRPKDGQLDIDAVKQAGELMAQAQMEVHAGLDRLEAVSQGPLLGPVESGVDRLDGSLREAAEIVDAAAPAFELLPAMLGEDGPRNYLFLFQNNAESRGTGGNPASLAIITADQGRISLTAQASSADFRDIGGPPIAPIDAETDALYGRTINRYVQQISLTPDFPTTGRIAKAFWEQKFGTPIDAVISFDPIGLQLLLGATGPVVLSTGDTLTSDDAANLLLNGVYLRYENPLDQDAFFASAASTVFSALTSGSADTKPLIDALAGSVDGGHLMLWSSHEDEQAVIDPLPIAGRLEVDNVEFTTFAVYVNDATPGGSKMDFYIASTVDVAVEQCSTTGVAATATATLTNVLEPSAAGGLPSYITGNRAGGTVTTDLVLYGPVGAESGRLTVDGVEAEASFVGTHLGRPVVEVRIVNAPGKTVTVELAFAGKSGDYGPVKIDGTPMVRATERTVTGAVCG